MSKQMIVGLVLAQFSIASSRGEIVVLDASSLPESQGWQRVGFAGPPVVQVEESGILFNSTGNHPNYYALYYRNTPMPAVGRFSVEFNLKVLQLPKEAASSAAFYAQFDSTSNFGGALGKKQMIVFEFDRVRWGDSQDVFVMATTDSFHLYRLDVEVGVGATLSVDGTPRLHRTGFSTNGTIAFGDMTNTPGMDANFVIADISFTSDCNRNGLADDYEIGAGLSDDCDQNEVADVCEPDCNGNEVTDRCDIEDKVSFDLDSNTIPDECEPDCNRNVVPDAWDILQATSGDCNQNQIPDECDIEANRLRDMNNNHKPDLCETSRVHVDPSALPGGDGSSWTHALTDLDEAVSVPPIAAGEPRQIWLRAGIYKPIRRLDPLDARSATFFIPASVEIYGGFAGYEDRLDQRDAALNQTILTGDLAGDDQPHFGFRGDNARHVLMTADENRETEWLFDSLTVRGGHADASTYNFGAGLLAYGRVALRNCTFEDNWSGPPSDEGSVAHSNGGGAVAVFGSNLHDFENSGRSDVTWEGCRFLNNESRGTGGGVFLAGLGVRFTNCNFEGNLAASGGAMGFEPLGKLYFDQCTFRNNSAGNYGGAIAAFYQLFELEIAGCLFENNSAGDGGALLLGAGADRLSISNCEFLGNTALSDGGAIRWSYGYDSDLSIENCTFEDNEAEGLGGAIAMDRGTASLKGCRLFSNEAEKGGAIHSYDSHLNLDSVRVEQNDAVIGGGIAATNSEIQASRSAFRNNDGDVGGAVSIASDYRPSSFSDTLFEANSAALYGGAIAGGPGELTIARNTLVQNYTWGLGAAILAGPGTVISDSIIWNNTNGYYDPAASLERIQIEGSPSVHRSIVEGWSGLLAGNGSSGQDPLFVNPTGQYGDGWCCAERDFRLGPASPARDAGNPDFIPDFGDADLDGHARVLCGAVDMGAYESGFGDADCDGEVDTWDFAVWVACAEGEVEGAACESMDSDVDGDFDLKDFAAIQIAW